MTVAQMVSLFRPLLRLNLGLESFPSGTKPDERARVRLLIHAPKVEMNPSLVQPEISLELPLRRSDEINLDLFIPDVSLSKSLPEASDAVPDGRSSPLRVDATLAGGAVCVIAFFDGMFFFVARGVLGVVSFPCAGGALVFFTGSLSVLCARPLIAMSGRAVRAAVGRSTLLIPVGSGGGLSLVGVMMPDAPLRRRLIRLLGCAAI